MKHAVRHIHFVGIGGSGMSGIAEILHNLGYRISGSDLSDSTTLQRLGTLGIRTFVGHHTEHVAGADAVVTSTAVQATNPEVLQARVMHIPVVPRALMLAELMRLKQGIAIAGTHGKTTTTSLVASVLAEAGLDPTFVIGGRLNSAGANARLGQGDYIVVEADESDASFLNLLPVMAVVTNIDADHMETYGHDFGRLQQAFVDFLHRMPFYGTAVLCTDDAAVRAIVDQVTCPVTSYGINAEAQVRALDIRAVHGQMHFRVQRRNGVTLPDLDIVLNLPGHHNVLNALSAIAIAVELNIPDAAVQKALREFKGVARRFQRYGDHAFQPHRFTRTRDCFEDFVKVMGLADVVLLAEVYSAGEAPIVAADSRALARAMRVRGNTDPVFVDAIGEMAATAVRNARDGDVLLCMGAGSISAVPGQIVALLRQSATQEVSL